MNITTRVALEVASHEAVIRQAYKDSVGVWTWSVGLTGATGHDVTRYIDNPAPMRKCLEVFLWALDNYADDVREVFEGHSLTEAQFAAALSFHWNTGSIKTASWVKHWKAGKIARARKAFMNWSKPKEIIPRRKAERNLFFDGTWANDGQMIEYTRLTGNHTPVWGSAVRRDVSGIISAILNPQTDVEPAETHTQPRKTRSGGKGAAVGLVGLLGAAVAAVAAAGCKLPFAAYLIATCGG